MRRVRDLRADIMTMAHTLLEMLDALWENYSMELLSCFSERLLKLNWNCTERVLNSSCNTLEEQVKPQFHQPPKSPETDGHCKPRRLIMDLNHEPWHYPSAILLVQFSCAPTKPVKPIASI